LLKPYTRERLSNEGRILRILGLPTDTEWAGTYIKPHGRRLRDGRQIAWSRASEWKATLMALHERSFEDRGKAFAAVLFEAGTKHGHARARELVEDAAKKLGIERIAWLD